MAREAMDLMSGEAEAREQRIAQLRRELDPNQAVLAAENDQDHLIELLKHHVALQDALIAELRQGHGHDHSRHQEVAAESDGGQNLVGPTGAAKWRDSAAGRCRP